MFHARKKQGKAMLRIFKSKFNFHHAREKMMLNFFLLKSQSIIFHILSKNDKEELYLKLTQSQFIFHMQEKNDEILC